MFLSKKALTTKVRLLPVNFSNPWWQLITAQKRLVSIIGSATILMNIFVGLIPFIIDYVFSHPTVTTCTLLFSTWLALDLFYSYAVRCNSQFQLQCIHSILNSAHQYLLTIDPRYHVHRSSGVILGKIDRAARGYEDLLDQVTWEFLPLTISVSTLLIMLASTNPMLALILAISTISNSIAAYFFIKHISSDTEQSFIRTDDAFKATAVENLAQIHLVRSCFASDYMHHMLKNRIIKNMQTEGTLWLSYIQASFIRVMGTAATLFIMIGILAWQVHHGTLSIAWATAFALAYINGARQLIRITKPIRVFMRGYAAVTDLFAFMPTVGIQSYPVLSTHKPYPPERDPISLQINDLTFAYNQTPIFSHNNLTLTIPAQQPHALYGIIGPSGCGKTTFLSMLGGQLKPSSGSIFIHGIDIYAVPDTVRQQLIALQTQVSTNVRGTVRYNLLFGLPETHHYNDDDLQKIITRVGLKEVLENHNGLDTMLGEGGLNISGGQRQRLNFAGLYLRAQHYKPIVILIDEPTSSLDELSEKAITTMIEELACNAITLVIAHRLKTISNAQGILDMSLLKPNDNIVPYTPTELAKQSPYYAHLLTNNHIP